MAKEYRKLKGRGVRRQGWIAGSRTFCSLWVGADHFLQIDSTGGFVEEYKRFYFKDIQALYCRKTNKGLITTIILAFFVLGFLFLTWITTLVGLQIFWAVVGGLLLIPLIINL